MIVRLALLSVGGIDDSDVDRRERPGADPGVGDSTIRPVAREASSGGLVDRATADQEHCRADACPQKPHGSDVRAPPSQWPGFPPVGQAGGALFG